MNEEQDNKPDSGETKPDAGESRVIPEKTPQDPPSDAEKAESPAEAVETAEKQADSGSEKTPEPLPRDERKANAAGSVQATLVAIGILLVFGMYVISKMRPATYEGPYDLATLSRLPALDKGRVKPIHTVARNSLLALSTKRSVKENIDTPETSAMAWYAGIMAQSEEVSKYRIFRVDHPEVLSLMGLQQTDENGRLRKYVSFAQIQEHIPKIFQEARRASALGQGNRSLYDKRLLEFVRRIQIYGGLVSGNEPRMVAPDEAAGYTDWTNLNEAFTAASEGKKPNPNAATIATVFENYGKDPEVFNAKVQSYAASVDKNYESKATRAKYEVFYNTFSPFYQASVIYVVALLIAFASWLRWPKALGDGAFFLICFGVLLHTFGLISRMYIEKRPPVTNLYSSAVFCGWVAVFFAIPVALVFRGKVSRTAELAKGFINVVAPAIGFTTLIVAINLAGDGEDSMQVMRAVLDTNFWLATHVVTVTMGYGATFLAGALGLMLIVLGLSTRMLDKSDMKTIGSMIYGVVCFAMLMSFVGTVLGGIWADQSWGRFWGWDPKENGALIIVIWNALILHARWGGMVKAKGLATLAIFGSVVTAWSWFGVNQLSIGLHSYGFTNSATFWTSAFVLTQMYAIMAGLIPLQLWRFQEKKDIRRPETARILALLNPVYGCVLAIGLLALMPTMSVSPATKGYLMFAVLLISFMLYQSSVGLLKMEWARGFIVTNITAVVALAHVLFLYFTGEPRYISPALYQLEGGGLNYLTVGLPLAIAGGYPVLCLLITNMQGGHFGRIESAGQPATA